MPVRSRSAAGRRPRGARGAHRWPTPPHGCGGLLVARRAEPVRGVEEPPGPRGEPVGVVGGDVPERPRVLPGEDPAAELRHPDEGLLEPLHDGVVGAAQDRHPLGLDLADDLLERTPARRVQAVPGLGLDERDGVGHASGRRSGGTLHGGTARVAPAREAIATSHRSSVVCHDGTTVSTDSTIRACGRRGGGRQKSHLSPVLRATEPDSGDFDQGAERVDQPRCSCWPGWIRLALRRSPRLDS